MTNETRLPDGFIASWEYVDPKTILEELKQKRQQNEKHEKRDATMWTFQNEVRPSDLYCYLGARFGPPNGIQNFLRHDSSDNLVHWEWDLKTSIGQIKFAGLNFRTDVWITGAELPVSEKANLVRQIKADITSYRKEIEHIRNAHLEEWIEFVNPYQRLRRAVKQQLKELDELKLTPKEDSLPSLLDTKDLKAASVQWRDRAADYTRAVGISFGIRAMVPVMAESFVNLLLFVLMLPTIKKDKEFRDGLFRQPMHLRIRSLPYYCRGFKVPIDTNNAAIQAHLKLIHTRNDLLHGNINVEKLKFNELYFNGKVPVFKNYTSMWERSLGVAHRAVGLEEVHAEIAIVDAFVEYLLSILEDDIAKEVRLISDKFDLGITKNSGRLGVLFGERLADFGMPMDQPGAENKTLEMRMIVDGHPPDGSASPDTTVRDEAIDSTLADPVEPDARKAPATRAVSDVQTQTNDLNLSDGSP